LFYQSEVSKFKDLYVELKNLLLWNSSWRGKRSS